MGFRRRRSVFRGRVAKKLKIMQKPSFLGQNAPFKKISIPNPKPYLVHRYTDSVVAPADKPQAGVAADRLAEVGAAAEGPDTRAGNIPVGIAVCTVVAAVGAVVELAHNRFELVVGYILAADMTAAGAADR